MRTSAQSSKATQQDKSAKSTTLNRANSEQNRGIDSFLPLRSTVGDQAPHRLQQAKSDGLGDTCNSTASERPVHEFFQMPVYSRASVKLQPKLAVNTPGDEYEREADRIADQVMRMPEPQLQRACDCGGGCPKCQAKRQSPAQLQRVRASDTDVTSVPPVVHEVLNSPGQPLDTATRAFMEPRFRHDFSKVRIHTDGKAAESARAVNALAYTVGQNVVFGSGQYVSRTSTGQRLLAHELTHVIQQRQSEPLAAIDAFSQLENDHTISAQPVLMRQLRASRRHLRSRYSVSELLGFARRPVLALRRWRRLAESERAEVLRHSMQLYGNSFAEQFRRAAESGRMRGGVNFHLRVPRPGELESLQASGYRFAQYMPDSVTQVWVHPTGEEVWFQPPHQMPPLPVPPPPPEHECDTICSTVTRTADECNNCCSLTISEPRTGHDQECFLDCIEGCVMFEPPPGF